MPPFINCADSSIVMAEQSGRDVVDQTLSGGEPSPSDVPASTNDKPSAGGDVGETRHIASTLEPQLSTDQQPIDIETRNTPDSQAGRTEGDKHTEGSSMDISKQGTGFVASRVLELNGVASASDGGDDTASLGGSESDASRTDGRHHNRTGSVKRPATFKPVSFAKFTVPKTPGAAAPPKAPEKVPSTSTTPLGTPQPSSRPRLVAKTTAGMRDSFSKTGAGGGKADGSGPDPNQVWNKNRPVQPTPPKHLTDEELKQQYGIHMTSRIQEDGGGTEAKWADIDDDEDDWAPETIEWTDGTKVTLTHTEPAPLADQSNEETKDLPPPEQIAMKDPIKIAAPKPTTSVGPNPTVLRLGASAERQAKAASISSKGTNDRVPSGSTSPAPPPAKSPWAALPPSKGYLQSTHQFIFIRNTLEEIAADDFNRQWREPAPGAPRELYNSRSGRYEPVADTRRGSWRHDQGPRPAVLQRQNNVDTAGPAEPSAAFQTHRSSHQDGMGWNRRRTSSNVSGGSGGFGRRMSFGKNDMPPRYVEARRGSQTNGIMDPALMGREPGQFQEHSPSQQHVGPNWAPHPSASASDGLAVEKPSVPTAVPDVPQEDPVVLQERIMKEKRLEARQRRIEQEEKEKAAKEERIRQKLAALGPAPDKGQRKDGDDSRKPQTPSTSNATVVSSPPKPPVPEPTGEPKQYGMMKVHHPDAVKKLVAANERDRAAEKHSEKLSTSQMRRGPPSPREQKREPASTSAAKQQNEPVPQDGKTDEHGGQWRGNLSVSSNYTPWPTNNTNLPTTSPTVKNPWKPLSSDRTLGNGIFEQSLGGFASRELPLRSQLGLDPAQIPPPAFSGVQESTSIPPLPSPETRNAPHDPLSPIGRPGPIGPPSSQQSQWQPEGHNQGVLGASWSNFHIVAAQQARAQQEQARQEFNTNLDKPNPIAASLKETWKPTRGGEDASQRNIIGTPHGMVNKNSNGSPSNTLTGLDAPVDGLPFSDNHARPLTSVPARSSRFFPHATEQPKRSTAEKYDYQRSPSPPPPEEISSHPVYFGGSGRPLVHLPNPKPVVKLPPKALAAPVPPPTFASMAAAPPRGPPAPSTAISWQEKINGLFGKKTPVEKKTSLAVASATKEPLVVQLPAATVSVSLPHIENIFQIGDGHIAVRQVEEQDEIFEDREPGSLPSVRVPNMAPANAWDAAPAPPQSRLRARILRPMQVHSIEPYLVGVGEKDQSGNIRVLIRLPGAVAAKTINLPRKAGGPNARQRGSPSFKSHKGGKPREASGSTSRSKKSNSSQQQQSGTASSSPRHQSRGASWGPRSLSGSR
ncbi:hypothetical protein N7462_009683 [Penicillium macrosclerotiorum]|uniref:uncharacterized protein n=1 Tax=Penicillium macrosclerotiorum TaxID=303699 RepID=UPI0025477063|nr:uncharacterized protein N7462_009683 [Penicillium macrosclerotiorum]KAJ5674244.1 hypothetical protein N7462_009683 [Penicillium macrosclerotiorum]